MVPLNEFPPIYIFSGGSGASAEQVVHTVLAQFPNVRIPVVTVANIRREDQIDTAIADVIANGGFIVHTLVNGQMNQYLVEQSRTSGVYEIDLMMPLIEKITQISGQQPAGHPGLYRILRKAYFERVSAIEYTMAHDDSKDPEGWDQAEIVLIGVSRVGKTPLSLYLSVLGWRVANAALVPGIEPPSELLRLDLSRVLGLTMHPGQLLIHRQQRQKRLGSPIHSKYTDPQSVYEEVAHYEQFMRQKGIMVINVTDKPIESSADEIMDIISRRLGERSRRD